MNEEAYRDGSSMDLWIRSDLIWHPELRMRSMNVWDMTLLDEGIWNNSLGEYEGWYFAHAHETGDVMASGLSSCIGFLVNVHGNHWVAVIINFEFSTIFYGDSIYTKPLIGFLTALHWWTHHHTGQHFKEESLIITHQQDSFSCGVETTTQQGVNKAPDCIYNCYRSHIA
jgi:hypothetical protein